MKQKAVAVFLLVVLLISFSTTVSSAKEVTSLAKIASENRLKTVENVELNAVTELSQVKAKALPDSYSSRDLGYTTEVRQQSSNICWAYSSLASLETLLLKSGERIGHLSPEHINVWGAKEDSGLGWQREDLVNDGGYSYISMGYLTSWSGPLTDNQFPIGTDKSQFDIVNSMYSPSYGVTSIKYITRNTPIETVKSYIMSYGAVIANFNANIVKYMNSSSDAFYCSDGTLPTNSLYGHAVSIVGWDDNYAKENFSTSASGDTPKKDGAWLAKNSWGKYVNANGGYFWISYEDAWIFHSIFGPSFAISGFDKLNGAQSIYQNETYGATSQFTYLTDEDTIAADTITYINVFDFKGDDLDKVVFESTSFDADYTVYYIPVYNDKPTQDSNLWTKLKTGTIDYTGYICVDVEDFSLPEGKGAIGISIDNTRTYTENKNKKDYKYISNSIGVCEWLAYNGGYYFKHQAQRGKSFVMYDEYSITEFYDIMDFYSQYFDDDMAATFVIKAITKKPDFIPTPTASTPYTSETTEPTTDNTLQNTVTLGITLEFLGDTSLTVLADASGGTGEYEYEFAVNNIVVQAYSSKSHVGLNFTSNGGYDIKVTVKDSGGRRITTHSLITVANGKILNPDASYPTDSVEPSSSVVSSSSVVPSSSVTPSSTFSTGKPYLMGDTDFNGTISIKDTTLIRKHLAKVIELDPIALAVSDVDNNNKCSIKDATVIQKYLAMIETDSSVGKTVMLYI